MSFVMVKKLVYLEEAQDRRVKQLARAAKTSDTEIIRRAVDAYFDREISRVRHDTERVAAFIKSHPDGWPDEPSDWFKG
jgi:hypothetical protein